MIATSLVNGDSTTDFPRSHGDSTSETKSSLSPDSESRPSVERDEFNQRPDEMEIPDLRSYYDDVVQIIDKLFDVSMLIRRASRNFRATRAASYVERDADGNDVLEQFKKIVSLKVKGLCQETPNWLVERMKEVVAMRRQQFYYQRAHKKNLARIPAEFEEEGQLTSRPIMSSNAMAAVDTFETTSQKPRATKHHSPAAPRTTKSGTSIKTYETIATELVLEDNQEGAEIFATAAPSEKRIGENIFPGPPKEPRGKAFECNQCFHIVPDTTRHVAAWRSAPAPISSIFIDCKIENTFFQISGRILVSRSHVMTMISYSKLAKSGSSMSLNSTTMNGGAMRIMERKRGSWSFYRRKNYETIFSRIMQIHFRRMK